MAHPADPNKPDKSRLQLAKESAKLVIETLTEYDQAQIIDFNHEDQSFWEKIGADYSCEDDSSKKCGTLEPMTEENKEELIKYIESEENINADKKTVFENAVNEAFNIMDNSIEKNKTSNCTKVLIFLTDGSSDLDIQRVTKTNREN